MPYLQTTRAAAPLRYLKIRRLTGQYGAKLQAVRKLRLMLGFQVFRRGVLQKLYEASLLAPGPNRMWKLVCAMEVRLGGKAGGEEAPGMARVSRFRR